MIGGDEGVEVGIGMPVSGATDEDVDACHLAASSVACFASIACLWAESVGTTELEASRSFPDAISNRLGREAVFVDINVIPSDSRGSMLIFFLF